MEATVAKSKKKTPPKNRKKPPPKVRIAMIGAGGRALGAHYPALHDLPAAQMVAVCDVDEERRRAAAERFSIARHYADYVEMIEREKPDAVYAIMPPHHLYDVAATTMEMGCHLFIEKPPALTTEQTRQMALIARRCKVLTGVTFQRRFAPVIRQGKARCAARGTIHTAHASFYKNMLGAGPYYRGAADILTCDGIHAVDTLRYLCGGEVESLASDSRRLEAEHWNVHQALVKFSSGATGLLLVNFMTGRRMFTVEVHAPAISFFGDPEEGGQVFADGQTAVAEKLDPFELSGSREDYRAFGAYDINRHFIDCVQKGKQPETNFEDAVKTMELVDAVYGGQI